MKDYNPKKIKEAWLFYCNKVLPIVYDESLTIYEVLCKIQKKLNEVIDSQNELNEYFKNLLVYIDEQIKTETSEILNSYVEDGTFNKIINEEIFGEINTQISNINSNIDSLEEKIMLNNKLFKPGYLIISDSYGNVANNFIGYFKSFVEKDSNIIKSVSLGGAGFANITPLPNFETCINTAISELSSEEKQLITHLYIVGGYNDLNKEASAIQQGIKNCNDLLTPENFPNLQVKEIYPVGWTTNYLNRRALLKSYNIYDTAAVYGFKVYSYAYSSLQNITFFNEDGVHPVSAGSYSIAQYLIMKNILWSNNVLEVKLNNTPYLFYRQNQNRFSLTSISSKIQNITITTDTKITPSLNIKNIMGIPAYIKYPCVIYGETSSGYIIKPAMVYFENDNNNVYMHLCLQEATTFNNLYFSININGEINNI